MKQANHHLARWIAVGVGALALSGTGLPPRQHRPASRRVTRRRTSSPATARRSPPPRRRPLPGPLGWTGDIRTGCGRYGADRNGCRDYPFLQIAQSEEFGEILVDSQCPLCTRSPRTSTASRRVSTSPRKRGRR